MEFKGIKGLRLAPAAKLTVLAREASELDQPRLALLQRQAEASQPFSHFALEAHRIPYVFGTRDPIVSVPHDDHIAFGVPRTPLLHLQIKRTVKVDIRQQRRDAAGLNGTNFTLRHPAVFQHTGMQPLIDEPHNPCVCYQR